MKLGFTTTKVNKMWKQWIGTDEPTFKKRKNIISVNEIMACVFGRLKDLSTSITWRGVKSSVVNTTYTYCNIQTTKWKINVLTWRTKTRVMNMTKQLSILLLLTLKNDSKIIKLRATRKWQKWNIFWKQVKEYQYYHREFKNKIILLLRNILNIVFDRLK